MSLSAVQRNAAILGGAALASAVVGGGVGAVQALRGPGTDNGLTRQERRDTAANAIIGTGAGMVTGAAIGAIRFLPLTPLSGFGLGAAVGAAALGAYTLARNALD